VLPIDALTPQEALRLRGLLFDLDDTLLDRGRLTEAAFSALFRLREADLALIVVTGRPAGWADVLVRQWPVCAVVAENGALAVERSERGPVWCDPVDPQTRRARQERLSDLVSRMRQEFPRLQPADDTAARVSDHTFDIGENSSPPRTLVESAASFARQEGATVTRSSVHLHVGFDAEDKASGAVRWLTQSLGENPKELRRHYAFIGDSENDASCFGEFETTIAVSNWPRSSVGPEPRYVTRHPMGSGFAEAARVLSAQRSRCGPV
jgi:hypothetical protein